MTVLIDGYLLVRDLRSKRMDDPEFLDRRFVNSEMQQLLPWRTFLPYTLKL